MPLEQKLRYINWKCQGSMNDIVAVLKYMTDGEFYTDKTVVPADKMTNEKTVDPNKLKLLDKLVYKLNKLKKC